MGQVGYRSRGERAKSDTAAGVRGPAYIGYLDQRSAESDAQQIPGQITPELAADMLPTPGLAADMLPTPELAADMLPTPELAADMLPTPELAADMLPTHPVGALEAVGTCLAKEAAAVGVRLRRIEAGLDGHVSHPLLALLVLAPRQEVRLRI